MYAEREMLIFNVESSLHAGAGASIGHIDNPLQRDAATGNPIVQANGVKGALREFFEQTQSKDKDKINAAFGTDDGNDGAGAVAFGEARLLFFPVRSLVGIFAYVTCPALIARLQRDLTALNKTTVPHEPGKEPLWQPAVFPNQYLAHSEGLVQLSKKGPLVLEELPFELKQDDPIDFYLNALATRLFPDTPEYAPFRDDFPKRAVILNDSDYFYFVRYCTEVEPHNRIDDDKGTVDERVGVWYTEYLPSESILYSPLFIGLPHISNGAFKNAIEVKEFIQCLNNKRAWLGGDRTTGKGRVMMHLYPDKEG